jgi:hypothetical protein
MMPFDLALPVASVVALLAVVSYLVLPRIQMRTYNRTHGGLRVIEVAFILSRPAAHRTQQRDKAAVSTEFVIYVTLKTAARSA